MSENEFPAKFRALILGGSGGIGRAFVDSLRTDPCCTAVLAISRSTHPFFDLESPNCPSATQKFLDREAPFDLVIDATGILATPGKGPEKSLATLNENELHRILQINAIGPLLLLKAIEPWLVRGPGYYAKLSARVGSITDNHLGGWYGYRASKATLNMMLQTAAIELHRHRPKLRVAAVQPGTVRTRLSAPYLAGSHRVLEPEVSVSHLLAVIRNLPTIPGAFFIDHEGQSIPW